MSFEDEKNNNNWHQRGEDYKYICGRLEKVVKIHNPNELKTLAAATYIGSLSERKKWSMPNHIKRVIKERINEDFTVKYEAPPNYLFKLYQDTNPVYRYHSISPDSVWLCSFEGIKAKKNIKYEIVEKPQPHAK